MPARKKRDPKTEKELAELVACIARRLTFFRQEKAYSQNELFRVSGVSLSTINELENGVAGDVRLSTVVELALALGVKPIKLIASNSDLSPEDPDKRELKKSAGTIQAEAERIERIVRKLG